MRLPSLSGAVSKENNDAQVYGGVDFRFSIKAGERLGEKVANFVCQRFP
jgi:hypothetical protein